MRRVVIVSTGRTATRSIAEHLARTHPDIAAFHITPRSTLINILSNAWLSKLLPTFALDLCWTTLKEPGWQAPSGHDVFVDSNNHLYAWARRLLTLYPDLLMVHVVRDPRSYVPSHLRWARQRTKSFIANYMIPFWQPNPLFLGEASVKEWCHMTRFEHFCWIWDFKNRLMRDTGQLFPERYLRIFFEDLVSPDRSANTVAQLERFVGIGKPLDANFPGFPRLNQTGSQSRTPWDRLTDEQCRQLDRYCGSQMREYGYGDEPSWLSRLS